MVDVDIVVLTADESQIQPDVYRSIVNQSGDVKVRLHRQIGRPLRTDRNRWETIARARNSGKLKGNAPYLMFVDDDVVLDEHCVATLIAFLEQNQLYGAAGANYLAESCAHNIHHHVSMGATVFRRSSLRMFDFRWEPNKCECQCCCEDLRRQHVGVAYASEAKAFHLPRKKQKASHTKHIPSSGLAEPRIFVALDRNHFNLLLSQFIPSLRASGNNEALLVLAYGFYPTQQRKLARMPGVEVYDRPLSSIPPMIKRLEDFQRLLDTVPNRSPVAFWDAGDVMFQHSLQPLWKSIEQEPNKFHAVLEPTRSYSESWLSAIRDQELRNRFRKRVKEFGFVNGGFGAATALTMKRYLRTTNQIFREQGLIDDQTAMNLFCLMNPNGWKALHEGWNYCLCLRDAREVRFARDGKLQSSNGEQIYVAHGNARTFQRFFSRSNAGWLERYRANSNYASS